MFEAIRKALPNNIHSSVAVSSYTSDGFWKRVYISIEAVFRQGDINHITGDVHFLATFLSKEKTVLTVLDVGFMKHPSKIARALLQFFWLTIPVKRAGIITTISHATKEELLKYVNCDPNKIKVVYVPISDHFKPIPKKINKEKPTILQLGVAFNKNIERLIEALNGISCHLEIVGKLEEGLIEKMKQYNISYRVSWNLSDKEILQKYTDCDIVTLISTYEGFGMPIVEGNAVGRPVITSNILSMPEVAGNAAHLVNPFDVEDIRKGIVKVIEDDSFREQMINNGFENAKRFAVEKIASDYCEVYKTLINV
nr:glycosyltransferase family 1 protein [Algoriphagus limi]